MTPISRYFSILLALVITVPLPLFGSQPTRDADLLKMRDSVWGAWFAHDAQLLRRRVPPETIVISAGDKQWKIVFGRQNAKGLEAGAGRFGGTRAPTLLAAR